MWCKLPNYYLYIDIWQWDVPYTDSTITGAIDGITVGNQVAYVAAPLTLCCAMKAKLSIYFFCRTHKDIIP
jgi:hypothetical protein